MEKKKKKIFALFGYVLTVLSMLFSGGVYSMAAVIQDGSAAGASVGDLEGGGKTVTGDATVTKTEQVMDADWYLKEINTRICEMKFTGTPIDQILRNGKANSSKSIVIKYWAVGQRALMTTLSEAVAKNNGFTAIKPVDSTAFGLMDTMLVKKADGSDVPGYKADGSEDSLHPLMLRVSAIDASLNPIVYAVNGTKVNGKSVGIPALEKGYKLLRLGRAAGEKDVKTGSYYNLPEPTEQYCQRFIMQIEQSTYDKLSANEAGWNFSSVERMALEDMRIGMEGSGLFGIKNKQAIGESGNVYTEEGIWYRAGKTLTLGSYDKDGNYTISEDELVDFVNKIIDGAGNGSRTKLFFVDNTIYAALCKIKSNKTRMLQSETDFRNWGLDFDSFSSMGTKLLVYRHDLFNAWGYEGKGFVLDPQYLDKYVFQGWKREQFNLRELMISNGEAVTMEEFSCWTLQFPNAHARVEMPEKVVVANTAAENAAGTPGTPEEEAGS